MSNYIHIPKKKVDKFNPDIISKHEQLFKDRKDIVYEFTDETYKTFTGDLPKLKKDISTKDFIINRGKKMNKKKFDNELKRMETEREITNKNKEKRFNEKNKKIFEKQFIIANKEINDGEIEDFEDLQVQAKKFYDEQEQEIYKDKQRFNNILDSVKELI